MAEPLIKKREVAVANLKDQKNLNQIKEYLEKKAGIITVNVDTQKRLIGLEYDLKKINFETIEKSLKELGLGLSQKITEKFKRGMAKFTEQNELDNLAITPSSCCEDPKEKLNKCRSSNLWTKIEKCFSFIWNLEFKNSTDLLKGLIKNRGLRKEMRKMAKKVKDLVCGMDFDGGSTSWILEYYDKIYYFCSLTCKEKFGRDPEKYVNNAEREIDCNAH